MSLEKKQGKCVSADVGPPETNIINRSKCNISIYIIIGDYIIFKIEILFDNDNDNFFI